MNESKHAGSSIEKRSTKLTLTELIVVLVIILFMVALTLPAIESARKAASRHTSLNNLRNIGVATLNYASMPGENLPMGGTRNLEGKPMHGWMISILPFMDAVELAKQVDYEKPWDAPENEKVFKTQIPIFLNPDIRDQTTNLNGYALTHYTANSRLFGINQLISLNSIGEADGMSNTILMGEIDSYFPTWGSAINMRDPAKGLHVASASFGGPSEKGVAFIFVDGRGLYLDKDINPQVLKALSTPNGGEKIPVDLKSMIFQRQ